MTAYSKIGIRTLPPRMVVGKKFTQQQRCAVIQAFNKAVLNEIQSFAEDNQLTAQADFAAANVMDHLPVIFLPCTVAFFDALNKAKLPGIKSWPKTYRAKTFTPG